MTIEDSEQEELAIQNTILLELVEHLPAHPTLAELYLLVADEQKGVGKVAIEDAINRLRRFGLIRPGGDVLEPTLAAIRAVTILT